MSRMLVSVELASRTPAPSIAARRAMGTQSVVFPICDADRIAVILHSGAGALLAPWRRIRTAVVEVAS